MSGIISNDLYPFVCEIQDNLSFWCVCAHIVVHACVCMRIPVHAEVIGQHWVNWLILNQPPRSFLRVSHSASSSSVQPCWLPRAPRASAHLCVYLPQWWGYTFVWPSFCTGAEYLKTRVFLLGLQALYPLSCSLSPCVNWAYTVAGSEPLKQMSDSVWRRSSWGSIPPEELLAVGGYWKRKSHFSLKVWVLVHCPTAMQATQNGLSGLFKKEEKAMNLGGRTNGGNPD